MSNFLDQIKDVYTVPDGMPLSVFQNKYSRVKHLDDNGKPVYQTWEERITDVVEGNFSLDPRLSSLKGHDNFFELLNNGELGYTGRELEAILEYKETLKLSKQGVMPYAGRHLQHGDRFQSSKLGEMFTNCSTALTSFTLLLLLMKGCFRAGTPVLMSDGSYKNIEDIVPGDSVKSWDEQDQRFCDQLVSRLNVNAPKPMVRVTFTNGTSVVCTEDHKFLLEDGSWVQAKDLSGRYVKSY